MQTDMPIIRALGVLLHYPDAAMIEALDEIQQPIDANPLLGPEQAAAVGRCIDGMRAQDLLDLQEQYVQTFDNTPKQALYLFQHLYGDSPDRGPAMADLIGMYRDHGYQPIAQELPDYLPLYCEFAAQFPEGEARALLGRALPVLELLAQRLQHQDNAYAAVLSALGALAEADEDTAAIAHLLSAQAQARNGKGDQSVDEAWQERPVSFTAAGGQCSHPTGTVNIPVESVTTNQHARN
jgi:nitrate reductase delta subunit